MYYENQRPASVVGAGGSAICCPSALVAGGPMAPSVQWPLVQRPLVERRDSVAKRPSLLRRAATKILKGQAPRTDQERREADDQAGKWYPVTACAQVAHSQASSVKAMQRESGTISWSGIMRCGSVWLCGECAQKIEMVRGDEVRRLIETARARGFVLVMLTHTFPHTIADTCRESMDGLADALRRMRQRGGYGRFRKSIGFVGLVRSTEVTHGRNGWHPHVHEIWILDPVEASVAIEQLSSLELEQLVANKVFPQWRAAAVSVFGENRAPSRDRGIDVTHVWSANDYLAKCPDRAAQLEAAAKSRWGADAEMTKTTSKKGRHASRTYWDILESAALGNEADRKLVLDYARGTWRKRRMYWTPGRETKDGYVEGLRARFGIGEELSDEQIADGDLPMTMAQAKTEREKKDPISVCVEFDLYSLSALGPSYLRDLVDRAGREISVVELARQDGWRLDRVVDHVDGYSRFIAVHRPSLITSLGSALQ